MEHTKELHNTWHKLQKDISLDQASFIHHVLVESSELLANILPFLLSWDKNQSPHLYGFG